MALLPGPSWRPGNWVRVEEGSQAVPAYLYTEFGGGGNPSPLLVLNSLLAPYVLQNYTLSCSAVSLTAAIQNATLTKVALGGGGDASPLLILSSLFGPTSGIVGNTVAMTVAVQNATLKTSRFVAGGAVSMTAAIQNATLTKNSAGNGGGDASPLLILSTLFAANPANKFLVSGTVPMSVTIRDATLAKGKSLVCASIPITVSIAPALIDAELTASALSLAVSVNGAGIYRSTILPLVANKLSYVVTVFDAALTKQGNEKALPAFPVPQMSVSIPNAELRRDLVLYAEAVAFVANIKNAFMPGEIDPNAVVEQPSGGYVPRKRRRRWYEEMPSQRDVWLERERLGIIPKRAQKVVVEAIAKAINDVNEKQAALLATAYLEEDQQRKLVERLRESAIEKKAKWTDDIYIIAHTLILDALKKKADAEELARLLEEQEKEQEEADDILELLLEL